MINCGTTTANRESLSKGKYMIHASYDLYLKTTTLVSSSSILKEKPNLPRIQVN